MEIRLIRWMFGVSLKERQPTTELCRRLVVEATGDVIATTFPSKETQFKLQRTLR